MCEFHDCNGNGLRDIWWTDKCMHFSSIDCMAFVSCYFMGTACRGGTVDACFVHNVTYMPV